MQRLTAALLEGIEHADACDPLDAAPVHHQDACPTPRSRAPPHSNTEKLVIAQDGKHSARSLALHLHLLRCRLRVLALRLPAMLALPRRVSAGALGQATDSSEDARIGQETSPVLEIECQLSE